MRDSEGQVGTGRGKEGQVRARRDSEGQVGTGKGKE